MTRILIAAISLSVASLAAADSRSVANARITRVQTYENSNTPSVWIHLNGSSRVGPNPANSGVTCELWTTDKTVYTTALAAMLADKPVDVTYVDNSNGSYWCKVQVLAIVNN